MKENLKRFSGQLKTDEALRGRFAEALKAIGEGEALFDKMAEIINGLGYEVTADELREDWQVRELGDEELEDAAGGYVCEWDDFKIIDDKTGEILFSMSTEHEARYMAGRFGMSDQVITRSQHSRLERTGSFDSIFVPPVYDRMD